MKLIYQNTRYSITSFLNLRSEESWILDIQSFLKEYSNDKESIIVNTSGSTGNPKAIKLPKSSFLISAGITNSYFDLNNKTALLCLPSKYIAGKLMIVRAIIGDMDLILEAPSSAPLDATYLSIDFVAMTPFQLNNVIVQKPGVLNSVKTIILGGGPVSKALMHQIQSINPQCYHTYGMTETLTHIAIKKLNDSASSQHFEVLDGFEISQDHRDCIVIQADHIYEGEVTTNDIVEIIDPKSFKWLGRFDNVINTGGIKVYPEVIESKIQETMDVPFFVIGIEDDQLGQSVAICIESVHMDKEDLLKQIESRLDKFEIPRSFLFFDCFLYTETGKIKRQQTLESR